MHRPIALVSPALSTVGIALLMLGASRPSAQSTPVPSSTPSAAAATGPVRGGAPPIAPLVHDDHEGWTSLFDGRTLSGWDGNPAVWTVRDGMIVAASTVERRLATSFLIWKGGELADFELKLELQLTGDIHSGITYRGRMGAAARGTAPAPAPGGGVAPAPATPTGRAAQPPPAIPADPRWTMSGIGMDFDANTPNLGLIENRGGGRRLGVRGSVVESRPGVPPRTIGMLGDPDALLKVVTPSDWTRIHIVASGRQFMHIINGHVMTIGIDNDSAQFVPKGLLGLQIEGPFGAGEVRVRNLWLKRP